MTCKARLASRLAPRLRRWRIVLPLEASSGQTPRSLAKLGSEPRPDPRQPAWPADRWSAKSTPRKTHPSGGSRGCPARFAPPTTLTGRRSLGLEHVQGPRPANIACHEANFRHQTVCASKTRNAGAIRRACPVPATPPRSAVPDNVWSQNGSKSKRPYPNQGRCGRRPRHRLGSRFVPAKGSTDRAGEVRRLGTEPCGRAVAGGPAAATRAAPARPGKSRCG
jgi:hypothetical protein